MQKFKNEKGITLVILVITIIVLSLISIPVFVNTKNVMQFNEYTKFKEDIDKLREAIDVTFFDKKISEIGPQYNGNISFLNDNQNGKLVKNPNDNDKYYVINVNIVNKSLVADRTGLNYGKGNYSLSEDEVTTYSGSDDVYIINEQSRTIYYVKGIIYNGTKYHRLSEELSEV